MNDTCNAHIIAATAALAEKRRVVAQEKKPITLVRPSTALRRPGSWRRVCEPKTADGNKLCWRPNTVAAQHYVESGLLPPSDCSASVRNHPLHVPFEFYLDCHCSENIVLNTRILGS